MIKKCEIYNESIKDKLKGKSEADINYILGNMSPINSLDKSISLNYLEGVKRAIKRINKIIKSDNKPKRLKKQLKDKLHLQNILDRSVIYSANIGSLEIIKYLVEQGAKIQDESLLEACEYGHLGVVKYLVEYGLDIHYENDLSLIMASKYGHLGVVKYLIENGANIHVQNDTPLFNSINRNKINVVKYLVNKGANIC